MEVTIKKSVLESFDKRISKLNKTITLYDDEIEELHINSNKLNLDMELLKYEMDQIFNNSMNPTWILSSNYRIKRVNEKMISFINKDISEIMDKKCYDILGNDKCNTDMCPVKMIKNGEHKVESEMIFNLHNKKFFFELSSVPFHGVSNEFLGIVETYKDVTEKKKTENKLKLAYKELEKMSMMDGLTEIANRRNFDITLDKEIKRTRREKEYLSILLMDIDFFKLYNDTYGHIDGDKCLIKVASILSSVTNRAGDLTARYGGEEFTIILPNTGSEGAVKVAERIKTRMTEHNILHRASKAKPYVTLSIGIISTIPDNFITSENLLQMADKALYKAKENGRDQYIVSSV